ncbi:MAG: radical SAM protein [Planctomycetes bacterium]|nr:radical SAM protein [Planctomycetota bacterium]
MTDPTLRKLRIYLIRPSRYDDEGYLVRHWKGVIPSNTLATMHGLNRHLADTRALGDIEIESIAVDEAVQRVPFRTIFRESRKPDTRVVVALCGVQSNQFVRALDLASRFRARDIDVLVGGFHVSGVNAIVPGVSPEIAELLQTGAHVVRGEVDGCWGDILGQLLGGTLPPWVDHLGAQPDLALQPLPVSDAHYMKRFAVKHQCTIDASRGCPFNCSFCTIINVQGRRMRARTPAAILQSMRRQYARGIRNYFFTDDNFARHPQWESIFDGMAEMRAQGMGVSCMMQIDTQAVRIPGFVDKAVKAGCDHVFIGLESINPDNLAAAGKRHNRVEDFREMIQTWKRRGVITQVGYILGFPADTPASIVDDVRRLRDEVGVDIATFFILMPLPGSADHARAVQQGEELDPDLNKYESTHALVDHPNMTRAELEQAYRDAWGQFYTVDHMKQALRGLSGVTYWSLFQMFLWYINSTGQGEHPMLGGFWRKRDRRDRRAGTRVQGRLAHGLHMIGHMSKLLRLWWRMLPLMQEVWLATRPVIEQEGRVATILKGALSFRPHRAAQAMAARMNRMLSTRQHLSTYWSSFLRLAWHRANPLTAPWNAVREWALLVQFLSQICAPPPISK